MNARRAPDVTVLRGKLGATHRVTRGGGDRDEATDARAACIDQDAFEAFLDSVIEKMAVGIDHGLFEVQAEYVRLCHSVQ